MGALYRITFPNGKSYIGITSKTAGQRLAVHSYEARRGTKLPLYHAMRKYGADCIALHTLALADDWQELCGMERAAIAEQHTRSPDGYPAIARPPR